MHESKEEKETSVSQLMEEILNRENMTLAYKKVKANKGASGVDGISVEEIQGYLKENWLSIKESIQKREYTPQPVLRVEIPKAAGRVLKLGIPNVVDRIIEQAIVQVITPIVITCTIACSMILSTTFGIPSFRTPPAAFGISTRRTGCGLYSRFWIRSLILSQFSFRYP